MPQAASVALQPAQNLCAMEKNSIQTRKCDVCRPSAAAIYASYAPPIEGRTNHHQSIKIEPKVGSKTAGMEEDSGAGVCSWDEAHAAAEVGFNWTRHECIDPINTCTHLHDATTQQHQRWVAAVTAVAAGSSGSTFQYHADADEAMPLPPLEPPLSCSITDGGDEQEQEVEGRRRLHVMSAPVLNDGM